MLLEQAQHEARLFAQLEKWKSVFAWLCVHASADSLGACCVALP